MKLIYVGRHYNPNTGEPFRGQPVEVVKHYGHSLFRNGEPYFEVMAHDGSLFAAYGSELVIET